MGSYHLWDYDWTPLSQNPCWNHTTILSLRDILRISCKNTLVGRLKESKLYGIEWNGSIVAIVCRRLNVKERLNLRDSLEQASSYSYSPSFTLSRLQTIATVLPFHSIPYNLLSLSLSTKVFLHEIRSTSLRERIVVWFQQGFWLRGVQS